MSKLKPKILIVLPYPNVEINPTMTLILENLSQRGVNVDVFCQTNKDFNATTVFNKNINRIFKSSSFFNIGTHSPRSLPPKFLYHYPISLLKMWKYDLIIGVNPQGLILAHRLNRLMKKPLVYISFEIIFRDECSSISEMKMKEAEVTASRDLSLILVQDKERIKCLKEENSISCNNISLVPVSPPPMRIKKFNYLRNKLNIPDKKKTVLYSGALASWASRDFMEEIVSYFPKDFVLVLHQRIASCNRTSIYLKRLQETGKIFISSEPVTLEQLHNLVASADYGLAPYHPNPDSIYSGENIYHIGFSSGKVSYYAMCGLPIIASALPTYKKYFNQYHCGLVYERIADIGNILLEMDNEYEKYSNGAKLFYERELNPVESIKIFCDKLLNLV